jgi:hypothetical protein
MRYNPIHFIRCSILCLAGYAIYIPLAPVTVFGEEPESQAPATPKIDHILLEVSNLTASIAFYRDFVGLRLKSQSDWFVMLESNNVGVFLRNSRWDWEKPRSKGEQLGLGMYPHFEVSDLPLWSKKLAKLVTGLSRSQGNMILAPKLSLLTLMVTLGRLYLRRRSLPVAKNRPRRAWT